MMDESRSGPDPFPRAQMGSRGDIYRTSLDHEMLSLILSSILDLRCLQRSDMPIRQRYHPSSCPLSSPEWSCRRLLPRSVPCDGPGQLGVWNTYIAIISRLILAVFWFAIQNVMVVIQSGSYWSALWPRYLTLPNGSSDSQGTCITTNG